MRGHAPTIYRRFRVSLFIPAGSENKPAWSRRSKVQTHRYKTEKNGQSHMMPVTLNELKRLSPAVSHSSTISRHHKSSTPPDLGCRHPLTNPCFYTSCGFAEVRDSDYIISTIHFLGRSSVSRVEYSSVLTTRM